MELRLEEPEPAYDHLFRLEGLQPGTRYYYRVTHVGVQLWARESFLTLPGPGSEVHLAAIGDSGTGSDEQIELAGQLDALEPHLLLHTGDTVYPYGSPSHYYNKFFKIYRDLLSNTCIYPSLGNHDCFISPAYWLYVLHLPANNPAKDEAYYSFDAGDAHFVALNSCTYEVPEEQVEWLEEDLAATKQAWKIVYFHHAPYSNAIHGGTVSVRDAVVPVFERQGVDLVLSGHDHVYERSYPIRGGGLRDGFQDPNYVSPRGIIYVVTGGGGATLYDYEPSPEAHLSAFFRSEHHYFSLKITSEEIEGKAIGLGGKEIDRFTIRKQAAAPALHFVRGDINQDGGINLTDGVGILNYLFAGAVPPCLAASDYNASGEIVITDAIQLLNFLFLGGPPPAAPFPECGTAEGADDTGCVKSCP
jgi:hypothetical protein